MDTTTKVSSCPITIRSIDRMNSICTSYYDHGRAALAEAILANVEFCFNPWSRSLRPMIAFYLAHKMLIGKYDLPTVEEVQRECQELVDFIKASRKGETE